MFSFSSHKDLISEGGPIRLFSTMRKTVSDVCLLYPWMLSKDVVLGVLYLLYLLKRVISLVDTVQYSLRA